MATDSDGDGAVSNAAPFFDESPIPTFVHDPETGEILDINEACEDLFGYDTAALREMDVTEFTHGIEEPSEEMAAVFERAMADGEHTFDWRIERPDGSRADVEVTLRPATVGGAERMLAFVTDVTESRKRERVLDELQTVATRLMNAESATGVADITTAAAENTIDFSIASVRLVDGDSLEVASATAETKSLFSGEPPTCDVGEGFIGKTYETGELTVTDDLSHPSLTDEYEPIESALCVPLGRHGVFTVGGRREGQFDSADVEFATLLTRLTEAALDQLERERRLETRTNELETLLNNAPVIFYQLDPDGTIIEGRGKSLEKLGIDRDEAVGQSIFELYQQFPKVREMAEQALSGEPVNDTVQMDDVWFETSYQPVFEDGSLDRVIGVAVDITEQKRIERQFADLSEAGIDLSESETRPEAIRNTMGIARTVLGESHVVFWEPDEGGNLVASTISEDSESLVEAPGKPLVHSAGGPVWEVYDAGETVVDNDFDPDRAAADAGLRSLILSPVGEHGLLTVADTEPGAYDERSRHLLTTLAGMLRTTLDRLDYERELERQRAELERSNESLQQFAYVASHDLQEPLRMVSSYVSLLDDEYGDQLDEEAREYMDYAVDGAQRMQAMIDALLQYSRVHTQGEEFSRVDSESVLEETLKSLELLVTEEDATVRYEDVPPVMADRSQLGQLFQNLVKNAIQHGGDAPTVEIDGWRDGDVVHVTVADDGPGVDPVQEDKIFEIFKGSAGGTGIGLAMCKRIVERHGGDIWVESEPDDGATFHFTLPSVEREEDDIGGRIRTTTRSPPTTDGGQPQAGRDADPAGGGQPQADRDAEPTGSGQSRTTDDRPANTDGDQP